MNRKEFANYFNIPYRTVENWETDSTNKRNCPTYLLELMIYKLENEYKIRIGGYEMDNCIISDMSHLDRIIEEIEKDVNKPYHMQYKALANELMPYIRQKYPYAEIYYYGIHQYIIVSTKAKIKLSNYFEQRYKYKMVDIDELKDNIKMLNEC